MIAPPAIPPARKTAHGATCSQRLSRLYTWLNANGSRLGDFSTDTCVEREMSRLVALRDELEVLRAAAPATYLDDLAADLGNLMRRTPAARLPARSAR